MNNVNYMFLEHNDTKINYSSLQEKEACKAEEMRVKYLFLEFSEKD